MSPDQAGLLDLTEIARKNLGVIHRNLTTPRLVEQIVRNREGHLAHLGPVVVRTAHHADCDLGDRYLVTGPGGEDFRVLGAPLAPLAQERFDGLFARLLSWAQNRDIYVQDCCAGTDGNRRLNLRIVTETAWHSLFARNLYHQHRKPCAPEQFAPDWTVVCAPGFMSVPERDGLRSSAFVVFHPRERLVAIGGTAYAGELRQAVGTITASSISAEALFLRCAVSVGQRAEDVAMFLGRTGTGKSTLAVDFERRLVGDHEHGWTEDGLFSLHWGCYPKVFGLDPARQPLIHACARRFGTILENVTLDHESRRVRFDDAVLTDNARACFPISHLPQVVREGTCGHPRHVFLLTRDTSGVLPPLARLNTDQAAFAFLTSFVSSLHETEARPGDVRPVVRDPAAGQGQAILPQTYARRFMEKISRRGARCWFVNTGWAGEPAGRGQRIELDISRRLIQAALAGELDEVAYEADPLFGFEIPTSCPGLEPRQLNPRALAADEGEYELRANQLAAAFIQAFEQVGSQMPESVRQMVANVVLHEDTLDVMDRFRLSF
jgi:phosphoenolpyruvate carboxykinase (ATP)